MGSKSGKIVSKKRSAAGKKAYARIKGLDRRSDSCEKGFGIDRLHRREKGDSALQEGEGAVCQVMPGGADRQIDVSCTPFDAVVVNHSRCVASCIVHASGLCE